MAGCYVKEDDNNYSYMDFYMSLGENAIMPEDNDVEVTPKTIDDILTRSSC